MTAGADLLAPGFHADQAYLAVVDEGAEYTHRIAATTAKTDHFDRTADGCDAGGQLQRGVYPDEIEYQTGPDPRESRPDGGRRQLPADARH